jgi:hypothetical protein
MASCVASNGDKNPPLRMPFGSDTVTVLEQESANVVKELADWRQLAISTEFSKEDAANA